MDYRKITWLFGLPNQALLPGNYVVSLLILRLPDRRGVKAWGGILAGFASMETGRTPWWLYVVNVCRDVAARAFFLVASGAT